MFPDLITLVRGPLALLLAAAFVFAACGEDGITPITEAPAGEAPEAPTTETAVGDGATPPVDESVAEPDEDEGGMNTGLLAALAIGALAIGGIAFLVSRAFRRDPVVPDVVQHKPDHALVGNLRWLHDQFSLELLSMPPAGVVERWGLERPRIDSMAIACQERAARPDENGLWRELPEDVAAQARALDTAVTSRAEITVDPSVIHETIKVVNEHRARLQVKLDAIDRSAVG